jgi:hypothetical protein
MSTHTDKSETIYIGCECHATEHIIRVSYYDWHGKDQPELYFMLQSDKGHLNFWQRLKMATNFLIGRGDIEWHDVIPNHNDLTNLNRVLKHYHADYKLWEKANGN